VHKGVLTSFFRKLGIPVDDDGNTDAEDWRRWQKAHGYLTEAFRAGNRARKKESLQNDTDAVSRWRIPKKLETIDDWEAAFLLNAESVGITATLRQSDSPSSTTRIYNLYVRSTENNSVTFSVGITKTDFYSDNSPFGIIMRVILKLGAAIGNVSMHLVPVTDAARNTSGRKIFTDLSAAMDSVWEIINYLRNSRHLGQVLKNPLILELDSSDVTMIIVDEYLRSEPGCPLIWNQRDEYQDFLTDYDSELRRATAVGPWINWHGDTEVLAEAFRAGNRARKKESISRTSNIVSTRVPSITELGDMLLDLGFLVRSGKRDYAEERQEKAPEEIDSILFSKWYTPSGKVPESGPIKESMILMRGGYGLLNNKESGRKIPYISAEIHVDIMLDEETVGKYRLSSLSSNWSSVLNLTAFNKVDEEFMPRFAVLMKLWSDSDRILKGLYDMTKDNLLLLRVDQYIQKAYIHRLLCRLMPEFESWLYSEGFGIGKEIDPDSWQWQASGWIKMPEIPEAPQTPVNEAFRAGNRARKKETVRDAVPDNVDPPIRFEDPNVEKICHGHGVYTIGDAAGIETIQGWFEIDSGAGIDNPEIVKFNELRYFTGLTTIPANAFLEQEKLEEIMIPDSVTVIGQCAFDSCRNLSKLVLPDRNSLELGNDCLQSCDGLDEVVVPSGWSRWDCIQNMKEAYDNELIWYQEKIDDNRIPEESAFELLDARLDTYFTNRQDTLDCRFSDLLDWWTEDDCYDDGQDNDGEEMSEAFRSGNRARKKESVQDTVQSDDALDDRNRCAEMMKTMLTSPACPAVRIIGDRPAVVENAPAIDPADIKISEHLGNNQDYTLVVLKWEGVDQTDPAQNLTYVTEISFSEATDGSGLLISGGCFNDDDSADFSPLPDMCIRADAENDGRPKLWELCYVEDWETVDPDGMTYSKVSVNAMAAVAAAVRQIKEQDRRKDPSSAGKYPVGEAFKAGNRARKKEAVSDTVQDTDTFIGDGMPADKIIPNLFLSAVSTTQALLRMLGNVNPPFKPEFPSYMKWFIDIIISMYIKTSISWQRRISIANVKGSPDRNKGQEFDIILEMGIRKYHFLITPGNKENQYAVWFKMTVHLFDIDFNPDYPEQSAVHIAPAMKYFIAGFLEAYRTFFEEKGVLEAFRAGNRARKKESVQDTVNAVDVPVRFEDPVVRMYMEEHGITTLSKVATAILPIWDADEQEDWFRPERFNEFKLFTSITHIKEYMFNGQENLEEIELPPTVQAIGYGAFRSCLSLENLDIPNSCRELGEDCLAGCDSLEYVGFPDSWTYEYAFEQFARAFKDDIETLPDILTWNDVNSWDEMPFPDATITNNYYTFHLSDLFKKFSDQDTLEMHGLLNEAFRAGNRARKKESAADTAEGPLKQIPFTEKEIRDAFRAIIDSEDNPIRKNAQPGYEDKIKPAAVLAQAVSYSCEAFRKLFSRVMAGPWGKLKITWEEWRDGRRWGGWTELGIVKVIISRDDFKDGTPVKVWKFSLRITNDFENDWQDRFGVFAGFDAAENLNVEIYKPVIDIYIRHNPYKIYVRQAFVDGLNRFFSYEIWEAFKAGNKARKKESVIDTVESVNDIQTQIELFRKQTFGIELEIRDGHPYFNGDLDLRGCTGLTSLPTGLEVEGDLDLAGCTGLTGLPAGLKVEGDLSLEGCTGLTGLPFDLVVRGAYIFHDGMLIPFFRKLGIPVDKEGDTDTEDWCTWQEAHGYLKEAFRAGNRARKKESAVDTVDSVNVKITKEEVVGWFRDAIDSDRNTIPKNDPHAWPAMCLVTDALFTRLAIDKLVDKIKESDSGVVIERVSYGQFRNPKGPNQFGSKTLGFVDVTAGFKDRSFSWSWEFVITIEDYKGKEDYCYKLYVNSRVNSESLLPGPKNEPLVTVYARRTPYKIEVNEKFIDGINSILKQ